MSKPYTQTEEQKNAPKPPSIRPEATDLKIWAILERCGKMMHTLGYNPETDFCKSKNTFHSPLREEKR